MGLDISAYSKIALIGRGIDRDGYDNDWREQTSFETVYVDSCFFKPGGDIFGSPWTDGLESGVYRIDGEEHLFRAGSYSGYNDWRKKLSLLALGVSPDDVWAAPEQYKDKAFYYLIDFSDCEGIIGTEIAKRLAADFTNHQVVVDALDKNDPYNVWFSDKYADWRKAFELASDNGCVSFH